MYVVDYTPSLLHAPPGAIGEGRETGCVHGCGTSMLSREGVQKLGVDFVTDV